MNEPEMKKTVGGNFTAAQIGTLDKLNEHKFTHQKLPFEVGGKVFLNELLGLTSAEVSLNRMPPKASMSFHHKHGNNEEVYIFIGGHGEFQVDDDIFPVREGSVIRVAPDGVRCWRNLSGEPLIYIVIQAPLGGFNGGSTISDGIAVEKQVIWTDKQ